MTAHIPPHVRSLCSAAAVRQSRSCSLSSLLLEGEKQRNIRQENTAALQHGVVVVVVGGGGGREVKMHAHAVMTGRGFALGLTRQRTYTHVHPLIALPGNSLILLRHANGKSAGN